MGRRILVTGGAGFIGSHLADHLLAHGHEVRALDALTPQVHGPGAGRPAYLARDVELLVGDVRDPEAVRKALRGVMGREDVRPEVTQKYRVGDIRHCFADVEKARQLLGYRPQVPFEEGLEELAGWLVDAIQGDVRDPAAVARAVRGASAVFHLAAQVAVTTSLVDPVHDFEVNARGTLNVLEAVRRDGPPPFVLFTSTNKVYGALEDVVLEDAGTRYAPVDPGPSRGISEARGLAFHSPYGCSKGAAEQYVLDWARTCGVPATVFRMSCIYGPRQPAAAIPEATIG